MPPAPSVSAVPTEHGSGTAGGTCPLRVLIVEDDPGYAALFAGAVAGCASGAHVRIAGTIAEALVLLGRERIDVVVLDRTLPDGDGLSVARALRAGGRSTPILLLTANASIASAVEAIRAGAFDYLVKDTSAIERAVRLITGLAAAIVRPTPPPRGVAALVGSSAAVENLRAAIVRCAHSSACVLIEGETGVGKELVARALHEESPRSAGPFVAINCGALPEPLVESELFGHVKGAFTGAHRDHPGLLVHAARGTLFLDEIEDLPLSLQVKLLRLLQESEYRPVGATQVKRADVRIVAASNADLARLVGERRFRRDLYYRLNVLSIAVPPLRERLDDIPLLVRHFVALRGFPSAGFADPSPLQLVELMQHGWPGNVRELVNIVERALVFGHAGDPAAGWEAAIRRIDAPAAIESPAGTASPPRSTRAFPTASSEEARSAQLELIRVLERHRWRRDAAARELGVSRVTLWRRMRRLGLKLDTPVDEPDT